MPSTVIDLTTLGSGGFVVRGSQNIGQSGWSLSSAGDVNGDGYADFIIGSRAGSSLPPEAYLIFGHAGSYPDLRLDMLDGVNGVVFRPASPIVASGDINGDGYTDAVMGISRTGGFYKVDVVYGHAGTFAAAIDLNADGYEIGSQQDFSGVTTVDINGDGRDDIVTYNDRQTQVYLSGQYINGADGTAVPSFVIQGAATANNAGDLNGDGYADMVLGNYATNKAWVLFGHSGTFANTNVTSLSGATGFTITGAPQSNPIAQTGYSVSTAGDVNGDGYTDMIVSAILYAKDAGGNYGRGATYVIFGHAGGFSDIDLAALSPSTGFMITGGQLYDYSGWDVDAAGDVNGDGYDDVVIGAPGSNLGGSDSGAAYVIFGRATFAASYSLTALDSADGLIIVGDAAIDNAGTAVAGIGDINHDGFDDFVVGAHLGDDLATSGGETYVVYGIVPQSAVNRVGSAASQTISGGIAGDTLDGAGGNDLLYGNGGDDSLFGGTGNDHLRGGDGDDQLFGGDDNDVLEGNAGNDTLDGGAGVNTATYAGTSGAVSVDLSVAGAQDTLGAGNDTLVNIQNLIGSSYNDTLRGDGGDNNLAGGDGDDIIYGGGGSDSIYGGAGADTIYGGAGNDYVVVAGNDVVQENAGEGMDFVFATATYTLAAGSEVEVLAAYDQAATSALDLTGNEFGNRLVGNAGANFLSGMAGNDDIYGGGGDDTLVGGDGNDLLDGEGGINTARYSGSAGAITVDLSVTTAQDTGGAGNDTLRHIQNLIGSSYNDTLRGDGADNYLAGADGNDTLYGGGGSDSIYAGLGADTIYGGTGNDYIVVDSSDVVYEAAGEGTDIVFATASHVLAAGSEIEVLAAYDQAATFALNLTGNEFANTIVGNAGDNVLNGGGGNDVIEGGGGGDSIYGGAGNDTIYGGAGNDTIVVDSGDTVYELAGQGTDFVFATASFTLTAGSEVETLAAYDQAATSALNLTGNEFENRIVGNAGDNILSGGGGNDVIEGGAGSDSIYGGTGADRIYGGAGNDTIVVDGGDVVYELAGEGMDFVFATESHILATGAEVEVLAAYDQAATIAMNLNGNEFANRVVGNAGANILNGGLGSDELWGNAGADGFRFSTALGPNNVDRIGDFEVGVDKIQLDHSIFQGLNNGALIPSAFVVGSQAADSNDYFIYNSQTGALYYDADGAGGADQVQFAQLQTGLALTSNDFFII